MEPLQTSTARPQGHGIGGAARAYVPRLALRWLASEGSTRQPHRRADASVLFADISGFTRLSERLAAQGRAGAEEVTDLVGRVLTALVEEIEARGGDVLIFAGDALVVLFEGADAPQRAARTAGAIRHWFVTGPSITTSIGRVALRVSVGLATGPVDLVLAGDHERAIFVAGPTVTRMVELERAAQPGEVLVDHATADAIDPAWVGDARDGGRLLRRTTPLASPPPSPDPAPEVDVTALVPAPLRRFLGLRGSDLEGEHRLATVAFVRAGGLDARLEREPDTVAADLDALLRAATDAGERCGVTVLSTDVTADGVTLFLAAGAPISTGEDEERMLRTLTSILAIPEANRLQLRAGANRGPVFAGDVGAPARRTYTTMGDTTNLAARIAARAAPGELLVTADVLARSGVEYASEALPSFLPKGKRDPVVPYRVGRSIGRHTRAPASLPLAGRDDELATIGQALDSASAGRGGVLTVVGEAGTGKTRLVQEVMDDPRIASRLVARFTPADEGTPYGGLRIPFRDLAGIPGTMPPEAAAERLSDWVGQMAPSAVPWLSLVAIPFGVDIAETPDVAGLEPAFRRERLHTAVAELLGAALPIPALLVLEDLHWADEASFALLESLARSPATRSWLVVGLQRPGPRPFGGTSAARIELQGLDQRAVAALAISATSGSPLSDADLQAIVERAGGNPLFARELAAAAAEHGSVEALPDRLESLLASRIDRLGPRGRGLLRRAAVLGRTVDLELLTEVLRDEADGEEHVAFDLEAWGEVDEFVTWTDPSHVRFRHDLIRDAAYEGLSHARRRALHGRLATAIERRSGEATDEVSAVLALHFGLGGQPGPAFHYGRRAGDIARSSYANVDAAALYRRALDAASRVRTLPPEEVAQVAESLGDVAELAGRYDESLAAYGRGRAFARDAGASLELARLDRKTGIVCERAGRYRDAMTWYGRGRRQLDGIPAVEAERLRIRLDLDRAGIRMRQGRYGECVRLALPAATAAQRVGDRALLAHAYYLLHAAYGDLGSPEVARYRDLALPIYEEIGDLVGQGNVLNNLGIEAYFEGHWDDALDLYARSKAAKTRAGNVASAATQSNNEAEILSDQGRLAEAEVLLRDALRVWGAAHYEIGIALATSNLGRVAARAGRHAEALTILYDAGSRFERIGAEGYMDETRARVAECLCLAGRAPEAATVATATLAHVRSQAETSILEAQLERTLGWCALLESDAEQCRGHLETSLRVARGLDAGFEVALTLRAWLGLPGLAETERVAAEQEATSILANLGVIAVAEPMREATRSV